MKHGTRPHHFKGIAFKRVSSVEADPYVPAQHEFNGVRFLKEITSLSAFSSSCRESRAMVAYWPALKANVVAYGETRQ